MDKLVLNPSDVQYIDDGPSESMDIPQFNGGHRRYRSEGGCDNEAVTIDLDDLTDGRISHSNCVS